MSKKLTDEQKTERKLKLAERKAYIRHQIKRIMRFDPRLTEDEAREEATDDYKQIKAEAVRDSKRKNPKANKERSDYAKAVGLIASKLYNSKNNTKSWAEIQSIAHKQYKEKHGIKSKKASSCKGVEPNDDDECDEPCSVKYKSKNGKSFCKSPAVRRASSEKKSKKVPKYVIYDNKKKINFAEGGNPSIKLLYDEDSNPVRVYLNPDMLDDDAQAKKDKRNKQQREYRQRKKEEEQDKKRSRSRSRSKSPKIEIDEDEDIENA